MKQEVLLVEAHGTVPENGTVAVIGSIRERNVAAVPIGEALRDIPKDGCEGEKWWTCFSTGSEIIA